MHLAEARCTNPACNTLTDCVVDDSATVIKCPVCNQYNSILSRRNIGDGMCGQCHRNLDDHQWIGDQAVCKR